MQESFGTQIVHLLERGASHRQAVQQLAQEALQQACSSILDEHRKRIATSLLSESDPKPRVESDHRGDPIVPSTEQFDDYFGQMRREHIKAQLQAALDSWRKAG